MSETTTLGPASLYSNPARQAPATALLDADAAFAAGQPKPPSLPSGPAGPKDEAAHAAHYQEWADWTGVLSQIINATANGGVPTEDRLKQIAFNAGVSYRYKGQEYYNKADGGVWIPG